MMTDNSDIANKLNHLTTIKTCPRCQKASTVFKKVDPKLHSIPIKPQNMYQIDIDLCSLTMFSNGYVAIVMAVCYFSKWIEARYLKSKEAVEVARFLYEDIICHHGCVAIQINDQGREFVNSVSAELHMLTGTTQRITPAYHPQAAKGSVQKTKMVIALRRDNSTPGKQARLCSKHFAPEDFFVLC
ncbi:hypothetical protein Pcinc_010651 [Petrolisthes cinctipes]|uniref:Integrase catalytic domain-containing protein n=1 Tax=Petrolisthes cinctipes TaxID=88211 RepID=A0AAE1KX63_PETCI|nr:hypothetical protein Pcinc_010651 [Petrolisthes cinctipes]